MRKKSSGNITKNLSRARLHHKLIFSLLGVIGVVLVWRGIWTLTDAIPFLNDPITSVIIGLLMVILSGFFFKLV